MGIRDDRKLADELCEIEWGLTDWEVEFVESIARQVHDDKRALTPDQRKKAEQIHKAKYRDE